MKNVAVNKFNQYFFVMSVLVLLTKFPSQIDILNFMITCLRRTNAICLTHVIDGDVITTADTCKSKTTCAHNNIDMVIVKEVINYNCKTFSSGLLNIL